MKTPSTKSIIARNVPDWMISPLNQLNSFIEEVCNGLNRNLTFYQNILCTPKVLTFSTSSTYESSGDFPSLYLDKTFAAKAFGVLLVSVVETGVSAQTIKKATSVSWRELDGRIYIDYVSGLQDSKNYSISLLVI